MMHPDIFSDSCLPKFHTFLAPGLQPALTYIADKKKTPLPCEELQQQLNISIKN